MSKTTSIFARVEPEIKEQAEMVLNKLGIPMSNAINIFLRQVILQNGLPFEVKITHNRPLALLNAGVGAVLAKSFARIFYRNAINTGLPVVICDTSLIKAEDELVMDLENGLLKNLTQEKEIPVQPLPPIMLKILSDGGLAEHFRKYGTFNL
jgi:addiction module RelB/DinJ family antitoxin